MYLETSGLSFLVKTVTCKSESRITEAQGQLRKRFCFQSETGLVRPLGHVRMEETHVIVHHFSVEVVPWDEPQLIQILHGQDVNVGIKATHHERDILELIYCRRC